MNEKQAQPELRGKLDNVLRTWFPGQPCGYNEAVGAIWDMLERGEIVHQTASNIVAQLEELRHKPELYRYTCWASGTVLVEDKWGSEPTHQCSCYNGDFNCGCRKCPWESGLIQGQLELQDYERHQNYMLDHIIGALKTRYKLQDKDEPTEEPRYRMFVKVGRKEQLDKLAEKGGYMEAEILVTSDFENFVVDVEKPYLVEIEYKQGGAQ